MKPFTPSSLAFPLPLLDLPAIKSWFSPFRLCISFREAKAGSPQSI